MKAPEKFNDLLEVTQLVAELGLRPRSPVSQISVLFTILPSHFFFFERKVQNIQDVLPPSLR